MTEVLGPWGCGYDHCHPSDHGPCHRIPAATFGPAYGYNPFVEGGLVDDVIHGLNTIFEVVVNCEVWSILLDAILIERTLYHSQTLSDLLTLSPPGVRHPHSEMHAHKITICVYDA
jgi:hypothetical protein